MKVLLEFMLHKLDLASIEHSEKFGQYLEECNRLLTDSEVVFNPVYDSCRREYHRILDKTKHL